jgi:hypothetical protein
VTPAASASERTDTERLDWLEAHPHIVETHGTDAAHGWHYGLIAHRDVPLREAIDAAMGPAPSATERGDYPFTRPECPFNYCDQEYPGICKERGWCHHAPEQATP